VSQIAQIQDALEAIGFRRAHYSVRLMRGRFQVEVIAWGKRWSLTLRNTTTDERVRDYLRRMLPRPPHPSHAKRHVPGSDNTSVSHA
jgi:hypothetical protein